MENLINVLGESLDPHIPELETLSKTNALAQFALYKHYLSTKFDVEKCTEILHKARCSPTSTWHHYINGQEAEEAGDLECAVSNYLLSKSIDGIKAIANIAMNLPTGSEKKIEWLKIVNAQNYKPAIKDYILELLHKGPTGPVFDDIIACPEKYDAKLIYDIFKAGFPIPLKMFESHLWKNKIAAIFLKHLSVRDDIDTIDCNNVIPLLINCIYRRSHFSFSNLEKLTIKFAPYMAEHITPLIELAKIRGQARLVLYLYWLHLEKVTGQETSAEKLFLESCKDRDDWTHYIKGKNAFVLHKNADGLLEEFSQIIDPWQKECALFYYENELADTYPKD